MFALPWVPGTGHTIINCTLLAIGSRWPQTLSLLQKKTTGGKQRKKQLFPWSEVGEGEGLGTKKQEQGVALSRAEHP